MPNLKIIILFLSLTALNSQVIALPQATAIPDDLQKEFAGQRVPIDSTSKYSCVRDWLQLLVDRRGNGSVPNELYVSKVITEVREQFVRVYWPKDNSIITMHIGHLGCNAAPKLDDVDVQLELEWLETKARIDLKKDVVSTTKEVGSSTYLVAKPWVEALIADCKKYGKMIELTPHKQVTY